MTYDPDAVLANPDAHPVHKRYAAINVGVRDRGELYQLTEAWGSGMFCSAACETAYEVQF